ncbi:MAG: metallophosphoesterase, partial [Bacteriovoracaceae bacterium]|nr:metallophosphoesterase [Bacteriovoracaceae bacterium]
MLKNIFNLLLILIFVVSCSSTDSINFRLPSNIVSDHEVPQKIIEIPDLEGNIQGILSQIESNNLQMINGKLEFTDADSLLVIGGDIPDRGGNTKKILKLLNELKEKYPKRVINLWGNREINKLNLVKQYAEAKERDILNFNPVEFLRSFMNQNGFSTGLDFHQVELARERGDISKKQFEIIIGAINIREKDIEVKKQKQYEILSGSDLFTKSQIVQFTEHQKIGSVSLSDAADDYLKMVSPPDGDLYKYIKNGQIGYINNVGVWVHGGFHEQSLGMVPDRSIRIDDPFEWISDLNRWGHDILNNMERNFKKDPSQIPDDLIEYGDAKWDPVAKRVVGNDISVIYNTRSLEGHNVRMHGSKVKEYFKKAGIFLHGRNHTPVGNFPLLLKHEDEIMLFLDTSYSPNEGKSSVTIIDHGRKIYFRGYLEGMRKEINYIYDIENPDQFVGKLYKDQIIMKISNLENKYVLFSFSDTYQRIEEVVDIKFLKKNIANIREPVFGVNSAILRQRKTLIDGFELRGHGDKMVDSAQDLVTAVKKSGRELHLHSGMSKFSVSGIDSDPKTVEKIIRRNVLEYLDSIDPEKTIVMTGGTHFGYEKVLMEEIFIRNIKLAEAGKKKIIMFGYASSASPANEYVRNLADELQSKIDKGAGSLEIQNNFFKFLTTEERLVVKRTGENNKISMIKRMLKGKDIVVDKLSILDDGWDFSLKEGLRITKMVDGRAFFLGGGGIVG